MLLGGYNIYNPTYNLALAGAGRCPAHRFLATSAGSATRLLHFDVITTKNHVLGEDVFFLLPTKHSMGMVYDVYNIYIYIPTLINRPILRCVFFVANKMSTKKITISTL